MANLSRQISHSFDVLDRVVQALSWAFTGAIILGIASIGVLTLDRTPPFQVTHVYPAAAEPGQSVTLVASVRRDLARKCDAVLHRSLFDGQQVRLDDRVKRFSAAAIEEMERKDPGMLRVRIMIPIDAAPGAGRLVSNLEYICNPTHEIVPITTSLVMPFTILAPTE